MSLLNLNVTLNLLREDETMVWGCSAADGVMIWDPFERFLWGIAIIIALFCGAYFIRIGRKREVFKERIMMLGLASLLLGFTVSLLFTYFKALQVQGEFINKNELFVFCGLYSDDTPLYKFLGTLSYISLGIGGMFFVLAFEIFLKRTKYLLTITFIIIIILEIAFFFLDRARDIYN